MSGEDEVRKRAIEEILKYCAPKLDEDEITTKSDDCKKG
jgi:hypothetical protein